MHRYKSNGLHWLTGLGLDADVPEFGWLTVAQWQREAQQQSAQLRQRFAGMTVAVRSDRFDEGTSAAGEYLSEVDIRVDQPGALDAAIARVVASYPAPAAQDRVLIQAFIDGADAAGVAASRSRPHAAPYQSVSWVGQARNGQVTGALSQCWTAHQTAQAGRANAPWGRMLQQLQAMLSDLQARAGCELEIEWLWKQQRLHLVQVRPLAITSDPLQDQAFAGALARARARLRRSRSRENRAELLGLMPDWNPAELLGEHPRPLACSLFAQLIGNRTWSRARVAMGYAAVPGTLLQVVAGRPYIRVARSLASLLPAALSCAQRAALVTAQLERLRAHPDCHDKLEFAIASGSYEFTRSWRDRYAAVGTPTIAALEQALRSQLPHVLDAKALAVDYQRARFALRTQLPWPAASAPLRHWRGVLQVLREHYALPFAQAARRCFAYEAILQSAQALGVLSAPDLEQLRASAGTLTRSLSTGHGDAARWRDALRPGTFEIAYARYGDWLQPSDALLPEPPVHARPALSGDGKAALQRLCQAHQLGIDADALLHGFVLAHQARDWSKLALSVELSEGLERLTELGATYGLSRAQLSWLAFFDLDEQQSSNWEPLIDQRQRQHSADSLLRLPLLLDRNDDLQQVICAPGRPAYLGRGRVHAPLAMIGPQSVPEALPPGSVVLLERCEPGFDWVFLRRPAAIVTAFGGPNAHVALRAHELNCPALLGIGPEALARLSAYPAIEIEFDQGWWHPAPRPRQIRSA